MKVKTKLFCLVAGLLIISSVMSPIAVYADSGDDSNDATYPEVGGWWINNYENLNGDKKGNCEHSDDHVQGLINALQTYGNANWIKRFEYGDSIVWEKMWKMQYYWQGIDYVYCDSVDLAMFSGHGGPGELIFDDGTHDDHYLTYPEAAWGDQDMEWVFLVGCYTLQNDNAVSDPYKNHHPGFCNALDGVHLICGSVDEMQDYTIVGSLLGLYLCCSYNVKTAWFKANDYAGEGSDCVLRAIADDSTYGNERIWGEGTTMGDPTVDNVFYSWTYTCS